VEANDWDKEDDLDLAINGLVDQEVENECDLDFPGNAPDI
jgi:hypothetical protein